MTAPATVYAVLYAAKSTEDTHGSIPTQLDDCRAMAEREGWVVVGQYSDEAESGWSGNRGRDLAAAMDHAERLAAEHGGAVLAVQHTDRLARGDGVQARHLVEIFFWAGKRNVQLRSVQDDATCSNTILAAVIGEMNAEHSRRGSLATRDGIKRRKAKGLPQGGPRKYGYAHARDDHGRTVNDQPMRVVSAEAEVVRRIYERFEAGVSQQGIARELNRDGTPPMKAKRWSQPVVSKILHDEFYAGRVDGAKGLHEPIITDAGLWDRVAAMLRAGNRERGARGGRPPRGNHLFRHGFLRCGRCGGPMIPRSERSGRDTYRCHTRVQDKSACEQRPVPRWRIDTTVLEYFEHVGLSLDETRRQAAAALDYRVRQTRAQREGAERQLRQAESAFERIRGQFKAGELDPEDWRSFRDELTEETAASRAERDRLAAQEATLSGDDGRLDDHLLEWLNDIRCAIVGLVRDHDAVDTVRVALGQLFEEFTLYTDTDGSQYVDPMVRRDAIDRIVDGRVELRRVPLEIPVDASETTHSIATQM
jgi:DNA invertase Pin-like site-specific DNA recombinase